MHLAVAVLRVDESDREMSLFIYNNILLLFAYSIGNKSWSSDRILRIIIILILKGKINHF